MFFFLIFPKMIPILMMFDLLQQEIVLISYMFLVFLVFMVSSSQSVLSIDFREILGWSSMGQMSWMILSLFSNIFLAIVYYFLYAVLLLFLIKYINQFSVKFFLSFSSYSMSSVKEIIIFFMLMFMSSVAPFLLFYMKMLIISSFFFNMFSFSMLLILFLSISILFFYLRMMQFLIGVGFYSSFYSMETKQNFMYFLYILFLFTFGGIFLLLIWSKISKLMLKVVGFIILKWATLIFLMSFFVLFILCLFVFNLNLTLMSIFLLLLVAFLVLLERKVLGLLQERKGPNMVSVFGLVQTIVDGVKLLVKYCYINYLSFYFLLLPIISLSLSYMHWLVLPLPFELFGSSFTIIFTFVVMGLMVYVILGCGFVSSSSYSIISAIRSVAQMISYEVVFMFYLLSLMLVLSSYSWKFIILLEDLGSTFIKFFFLLTWLVLSLSELNRTPFDLVEGESELVSGFNVEYSSFGFTLLFLSEYMNIWFMSILFMLLYNSSLTFMCFSVIFYVLLNLFIRGLLPRYKFIQLINLMWKVFLPFVFIILLFFMVNIFL